MSLLLRWIGVALVTVGCLGWLNSDSWAGERLPLFAFSVAEKKIAEALASPTELEFQATPLTDVIDYLKDHHAIEIQIDTKALSDVGLQPDTPISKDLKGVSLRSALNLMLGDLDLTYVVRDEVLLITTEEEAKSETNCFTRVYRLSDLAGPLAESEESRYDADQILQAILTTVEPDSWRKEEGGGTGTLSVLSLRTGPIMVIRQSWPVHEEIVELLESLRDVATMESAFSAERRHRDGAEDKNAR